MVPWLLKSRSKKDVTKENIEKKGTHN